MKGKGILHTNPSGYDEANNIRVITIVGENRGAKMKITQSQKKQQPIQKSDKVVRTLYSTPIMKVVYSTNNNVQCVNNSMVFNSMVFHSTVLLKNTVCQLLRGDHQCIFIFFCTHSWHGLP